MGGKTKYWQNVIKTFNTSIIGYWPLWEDAGTVAQDISGNGRNGAYKATGITYGQPGVFGGTKSILNATGDINLYSAGLAAAFSGTEGSYGIWYKPTSAGVWTNGAGGDIGFLYKDASNRILFYKSATNNLIAGNYIAGGTNTSFGVSKFAVTTWFHIWLTWSDSGDFFRWYINGSRQSLDVGQTIGLYGATAVGTWSGDPTGMMVSGGYQGSLLGNIAFPILLNRAITDDEAHALHPFGLLLFDGDSRTGGKPYPHDAFKASTKTTYTFLNKGNAGYTVAQMISGASTNVDAYYRNNGQKNIVIIWGGVNSSGLTAAAIYAELQTYCLARKARGWKVIICTEIDAVNAGWTAKYQELNTLLRAGYTSFADGIADLGANANLQDNSDITYYNADGVHLTAAGYTVVSGIVQPVIDAL